MKVVQIGGWLPDDELICSFSAQGLDCAGNDAEVQRLPAPRKHLPGSCDGSTNRPSGPLVDVRSPLARRPSSMARMDAAIRWQSTCRRFANLRTSTLEPAAESKRGRRATQQFRRFPISWFRKGFSS